MAKGDHKIAKLEEKNAKLTRKLSSERSEKKSAGGKTGDAVVVIIGGAADGLVRKFAPPSIMGMPTRAAVVVVAATAGFIFDSPKMVLGAAGMGAAYTSDFTARLGA